MGISSLGLLLLFAALQPVLSTPSRLNERVCLGTASGISVSGYSASRYNRYRNRYTNCTFVDGNLELAFLNEKKNYDLSFLRHIREVTGYVLILGVHANKVPLTSLQLIRGKHNLEWTDGGFCSLCVLLNFKANSSSIGLQELQLPSLTEISAGNVVIYNNQILCHIDTIRWDMISSKSSKVNVVYKSKDYLTICPSCSPSCSNAKTNSTSCWGAAPSMCQTQNSGAMCSSTCENRCYGELPNQCCHSECSAGCFGTTETDCFACRQFNDKGSCLASCPPEHIYEGSWLVNPDKKYAFGDICVSSCPGYLLQHNGVCVMACPTGMVPKDGTCVPCQDPCPKECEINDKFLHAYNIDTLRNCVILRGYLNIIDSTFKGDPFYKIPPMKPEKLEALSKIKEVTGFISITSTPPEVENLMFLRNLEDIDGQNTNDGFSLIIVTTGLTSLTLSSLKHVRHGNVFVTRNKELCYAHSINFTSLFLSNDQRAILRDNKPANECVISGNLCDRQCSPQGCWGAGPAQCMTCLNKVVEPSGLCVDSCLNISMVYTAGSFCRACHPQCVEGCTGPDASMCNVCKNVKFKQHCLEKCPRRKLPNAKKICKPIRRRKKCKKKRRPCRQNRRVKKNRRQRRKKKPVDIQSFKKPKI